MGGIKNRDEKRKKAHVYSSGGGGGAKGPSVVDKRGQEEKCPHCDRTFKQNSRLKEHILKQHPQQAEAPEPTAAAPPAAAAAAAPAGGRHQAGVQGHPVGRMFDVGSSGGFYTEKSPKLMLLEWCARQKRPKPKYKAVAQEPDRGAAGFRARVVLPDPKHPGSDKDVVVWLEGCHAAEGEEEACQRGAVAALVAVAGECSYDYVLPQRYRPLWTQIKHQAKERAEAQRSGGGLQPYLDWLCLNLPVERLPSKYRPGGSSGTVGVLRVVSSTTSITDTAQAGRNHRAAGQGPSNAHQGGAHENDDVTWQDDPLVQQLLTYGYPPDHAMLVLQQCRGDLVLSLHHLQQQLLSGTLLTAEQASSKMAEYAALGGAGAAAAAAAPKRPELPEAWLNELEVLEAIYAADIDTSAALDQGCVTLTLDASHVGLPCPVQLMAWCPCRPVPYPEGPPLVAITCRDLSGPELLSLTAQLATAAAGLTGDPMIHELAVQLGEGVEQLLGGADATSRPSGPAAPPPYDAPAVSEDAAGPGQPAVDDAEDKSDGYSTRAQLHADAAEAIMAQDAAAHAPMRAARAKLPAASCRSAVVDAVDQHSVVVISGATGCGKSTQVPQYLLEAAVAAGDGGSTNIIVCQPRRIAAVGLASRVAEEVGDAVGVGGVVGYSVRLDSRTSSATRLLFCTTGVLLRRLMDDPDLTGVTHVVLDEVHERNLDSDLLLLLLRRSLLMTASSPQGSRPRGQPPKLLLMSATADSQMFADYFTQAGPEALLMQPSTMGQHMPASLTVRQLTIPGFTHPVRQLWLEDALQQTGIIIGKQSRYAKRQRPTANSWAAGDGADDKPEDDIDEEETLETAAGGNGAGSDAVPESGGNGAGLGADAPQGGYDDEVMRSLQLVDPALINYELIEALVCHVLEVQQQSGPAGLLKGWRSAPAGALEAAAASAGGRGMMGAVLIFMPGAPEIDRLVRQLQGSSRLTAAAGGAKGLRVLPLHGGLPAGTQARVFERPRPGVLKVVVATNVAETSLTIDDVTVVIDTGRHKEMSYDASRGLSRLSETWVSQAAAQQRRGRAGRVAPGTCYRLWPSRLWSRLPAQQPPEVLRVPLQQLCLTTKATLAAAAAASSCAAPDVADVLRCLLTPPSTDAVLEACRQLSQLGALSRSLVTSGPAADIVYQGEMLTALGSHLAAMPMDAALGKALLYGCMLRCASPLLTIAAALAHGRPLWLSPAPDRRSEVNAARQALAPQAYSQRSDHLAVIAAFNGWIAARTAGGRSGGVDFARQYSLSDQVLEAVAKGRLDFAVTLQQRGFLPEWYSGYLCQLQQQGSFDRSNGNRAVGTAGVDLYGADAVAVGAPDEFSHNARIVKAAICAGFYPRILRVEAPARYQQVSAGAVRVEAAPQSIKFFDRGLGRVWIHPASVCFSAGSYSSGWCVYTQLVETNRPFAREVSMVPIYALLAFGGELEVLHDQGLLLLDGWARFKAPARVGVLIKHLRHAVSGLLAAKINDPGLPLTGQKAVEAMHALLATDGF
eukprot:gene4412-4665_t